MAQEGMMDAKRYIVVIAIALPAALAVLPVAGCIPDRWKPYGWWWEGDPYPAPIQELKAPDTVALDERATIRAVVWIGYSRKIVEESVEVVKATYTVRIKLILRAYGDYLARPANIPPPTEKLYTVSFPVPGEWTIQVNDESVPITVLPAET